MNLLLPNVSRSQGEVNFTNLGTSQAGAPGVFLTGTASGYFFGGARTIETAERGAIAAFQCRAWSVAFGDSYEAALTRGLGTGKGPIFELKTKDPLDPIELRPNVGNATGFRGFSILVPEPSCIGLGITGMALVVALGVPRRKS